MCLPNGIRSKSMGYGVGALVLQTLYCRVAYFVPSLWEYEGSKQVANFAGALFDLLFQRMINRAVSCAIIILHDNLFTLGVSHSWNS